MKGARGLTSTQKIGIGLGVVGGFVVLLCVLIGYYLLFHSKRSIKGKL